MIGEIISAKPKHKNRKKLWKTDDRRKTFYDFFINSFPLGLSKRDFLCSSILLASSCFSFQASIPRSISVLSITIRLWGEQKADEQESVKQLMGDRLLWRNLTARTSRSCFLLSWPFIGGAGRPSVQKKENRVSESYIGHFLLFMCITMKEL